MDGSLPVWAQNAGMLAIAAISAILGVFRYLKTQAKEAVPSGGSASVLSASFIDSKLLKELIDTVREGVEELSRDSKKAHRQSQELRDAVNELNESIIVQTDATTNLVRFVNRNQAKRTSDDTN